MTALARIVHFLPFPKRYLILKTFIESQFSYCLLVWMFCSNTSNNKINHIQALRLVYQDYSSTFEELLVKDKLLCFHHRNIHQVAIEMYKVKNDLSPPFMKDIFSETNRKTRSGNSFSRPNGRFRVKVNLTLFLKIHFQDFLTFWMPTTYLWPQEFVKEHW